MGVLLEESNVLLRRRGPLHPARTVAARSRPPQESDWNSEDERDYQGQQWFARAVEGWRDGTAVYDEEGEAARFQEAVMAFRNAP